MNITDSVVMIFYDLTSSTPRVIDASGYPQNGTVVALGNFDGVHAAHEVLLRQAVALSHARRLHSVVFCFDPPSSDFFSSDAPEHLTTCDEKLRRFATLGMEYAAVADFSRFREQSANAFLSDVLMGTLHAQAVVCGFNFHFGRGGTGDGSLLRAAFGDENTMIIPPQYLEIGSDPILICSTRIRRFLSEGNTDAVRALLGRPYSLTATVTAGKQLGRQIGIPTANQFFPKGKMIPKPGVYATICRVGSAEYNGVTNVGVRPTVDGSSGLNCETHLINFRGNLYGQEITVEFHRYLRPENSFSDLASLRAAIERDIGEAERFAAK